MAEVAFVKIKRNDPSMEKAAYYDIYSVPYESGNTVMDAMQYIYSELDGSLAHRCACRAGYCGVCIIKLNGKHVNPCKTHMSKEMVIEPMESKALIRDLVIDFRTAKKK